MVVLDVEIVHVPAVVGRAFSEILEHLSHLTVRHRRPDTRYVVTRGLGTAVVVGRGLRAFENRFQRRGQVAVELADLGRRRRVQGLAAFHRRPLVGPIAAAAVVLVARRCAAAVVVVVSVV